MIRDIKDYVIRQFRPSCIVFSTPSAQAMCRENNLTPAELLSPFGDISNEIININTSEKNTHQLHNFVVEFFDSIDYETIPSISPVIQSSLRHKVITANAPKISLSKVIQSQKVGTEYRRDDGNKYSMV